LIAKEKERKESYYLEVKKSTQEQRVIQEKSIMHEPSENSNEKWQ